MINTGNKRIISVWDDPRLYSATYKRFCIIKSSDRFSLVCVDKNNNSITIDIDFEDMTDLIYLLEYSRSFESPF